MSRYLFYLQRLTRVLWLRASLYAVGAVAAALVANALGPWAPAPLAEAVGEESLEEILKMMASSMLAVATFSLTTLVAAYGSVTTHASPRAAALLIEDRSAQAALSAFIGAFIYSVVALIALGTGFYSPADRFVLFVVSLVVLAIVVLRLLRWIDQLSRLGRVGEAVSQVEAATRNALAARRAFLGGRPAGRVPRDALPIHAEAVGYVQHVDSGSLQKIAERERLTVHLGVLPGAFVRLSRAILYVVADDGAAPDEDVLAALREAVVVGDTRTFQQDPRFGLVVLGEIASRALSPAVNDPGTAIAVVGATVRILSTWAEDHWEAPPEQANDRVLVPPLSAHDIFQDVFRPIARHGAGMVEVGVALQKAFRDLAVSNVEGFREAAVAHSRLALDYAGAAQLLEVERRELREAAAGVKDAGPPARAPSRSRAAPRPARPRA